MVCKHLWAALVQLATLHLQGICIPSISLPTSCEEACTRFYSHRPIVSLPQAGTPQLKPLTNPDDAMDSGDAPTSHGMNLYMHSEGLPPSILSTHRTAQVVDDIVRESGDMFINPRDRRFAGSLDMTPTPETMATDGSCASDKGSESDVDSSGKDKDSNEKEQRVLLLTNISRHWTPQEVRFVPVAVVA